MDVRHPEGNEEKSDGVAWELLRFTTERLPRYRWLARGPDAGDPEPDLKRQGPDIK